MNFTHHTKGFPFWLKNGCPFKLLRPEKALARDMHRLAIATEYPQMQSQRRESRAQPQPERARGT